MRHMVERKMEEVQASLSQIRGLMARYLPLGPGALQHAFQTGSVALEHNGALGNSVVLHDYAKQGDSLSMDLSMPAMGLRGIRVRSYFESPSDILTADVHFATLPDGTQYPSITMINAPGRGISITTVQSDFSKPIQ